MSANRIMDVHTLHWRSSVRVALVACVLTAVSSVATAQTLSGWTATNVGSPLLPGTSSLSGSTVSVSGAGADVFGSSDQFMFVYRQMTGDGVIISRVPSVQNVHASTKAGVMIRESLTAGSRNAFALVTPSKGVQFQRRTSTGGSTAATLVSGAAPSWLKLERVGSSVTASRSADGVTWTAIGTQTVTLPSTVYVGLAVTSHSALRRATGTFASVTVSGPTTPPVANQAPTVSLTAPATGAAFTAPASVSLAATAADTDGTVSSVDFYAGSTLVATDTAAPYTYTWANVAAGSYSITAVARDNAGATTTSAAHAVTVAAAGNQAPVISLTSPVNGATFTAPGSLALTATATDADGSIARVDFYQGTTLIATDTTLPYAYAWSNVAAGSYSITAVARDNAGASATTAATTVTVSSTNQAPLVSLTSPVSGTKFTTPASLSLTATASDADGSIARVEFYQGTTLLGSDTSAPYAASWTGVATGIYSLTAVAYDAAGAMTVSSAVSTEVRNPAMPQRAAFAASANHDTAVDRYVLEIFTAGANPAASNAIATVDMGKPQVVNGECVADVGQAIAGLAPGNYVATVTAMGQGGSARSAESAQFTR